MQENEYKIALDNIRIMTFGKTLSLKSLTLCRFPKSRWKCTIALTMCLGCFTHRILNLKTTRILKIITTKQLYLMIKLLTGIWATLIILMKRPGEKEKCMIFIAERLFPSSQNSIQNEDLDMTNNFNRKLKPNNLPSPSRVINNQENMLFTKKREEPANNSFKNISDKDKAPLAVLMKARRASNQVK